jgi:hypothetical protein
MIYFIRAGKSGNIKIGYTGGTVKHRRGDLQPGNSTRLLILGVMDGDRSRETQLHRQFNSLHVRGDWFRAGQELRDFIRRHARPVPDNVERFGEKTPPLAYLLLAELEPRLVSLWQHVLGLCDIGRKDPHFCANACWYGEGIRVGIEPFLTPLVGSLRRNGPVELQTDKAFMAAAQALWDLVPDCKDCGCGR